VQKGIYAHVPRIPGNPCQNEQADGYLSLVPQQIRGRRNDGSSRNYWSGKQGALPNVRRGTSKFSAEQQDQPRGEKQVNIMKSESVTQEGAELAASPC